MDVRGLKFWTSSPAPSKEFLSMTGSTEGEVMLNPGPAEGTQKLPLCRIQITSEKGALCIINPLFLDEHGDGWLSRDRPGPRGSQTRTTIRLSNPRNRVSAKVNAKKISIASVPLTQWEEKAHEAARPEENEMKGPFPGAEDRQSPLRANVRRKTLRRHHAQCDSGEMDSEVTGQGELARGPWFPKQGSEDGEPEKGSFLSRHRATWIEEGHLVTWKLMKSKSESSLISADSFLLPPIPEQDSLSFSSAEDEGDSQNSLPTPRKKRNSPTITDKVRNSLMVVSSAFWNLLPLQKRITYRVLDLSNDPSSSFGRMLQSFLSHMLKGPSQHLNSTDMLQEIRQTMTNLKTYLWESSELHSALENGGQSDFDLDSILEKAVAKCLLKPLKGAIYSQLLEFHTKDGSLKKLRENQKKMKAQSLPQLGVTAGVPDEVVMEKILQMLQLMHSLYSPKEKVIQLLKVCKLIYEAMNRVPGKKEVYGADDFLPVLTYVMLGCDINFLRLDVEYMMELLDPSQLQGEGGYYLTTVFGALFHIGNIQHSTVTRQISLEAQRSLYQWQRRRTTRHGNSIDHDFLYVSLREPFNNQKVLTVSADMTTASVCAICRQKFQIHDKEDYGLFLIGNNEVQQLESDSFPQQVKAELLKAGASSVVFVFKPKTGTLP
ncbi:ras and Rab interactor-like protein isoform X2 [Lissotriton helveticus]